MGPTTRTSHGTTSITSRVWLSHPAECCLCRNTVPGGISMQGRDRCATAFVWPVAGTPTTRVRGYPLLVWARAGRASATSPSMRSNTMARRILNWQRTVQMADDWLIWQFVDLAFPAGSFAHSGWLQCCKTAASTRESLLGFIDLLTQISHGSLPLVLAAHREPLVSRNGIGSAMQCSITSQTARAVRAIFAAAAQRIYGRPQFSTLQSTVRRTGCSVPGPRIRRHCRGDELFADANEPVISVLRPARPDLRCGAIGDRRSDGSTRPAGDVVPKGRTTRIGALEIQPQDAAQTAPIF